MRSEFRRTEFNSPTFLPLRLCAGHLGRRSDLFGGLAERQDGLSLSLVFLVDFQPLDRSRGREADGDFDVDETEKANCEASCASSTRPLRFADGLPKCLAGGTHLTGKGYDLN